MTSRAARVVVVSNAPSRRLSLGLTATLATAAPSCAGPPAERAPLVASSTSRVASASASASVAAPAPPSERELLEKRMRAELVAMLERVREARKLPLKKELALRVLDRPDLVKNIREKVEREVPKHVMLDQGEMLKLLELVPTSYDVIEGAYELIGDNIAGYYDPDTGTMFLASDLGDSALEETLAHELVHALQDQSWALSSVSKYRAGEADRQAAMHALAEGDATSASLDVTTGDSFRISASMLRKFLGLGTGLMSSGVPPVLRDSLIAPYADGFELVQELRRRGGWAHVDAMWQRLPATTEQMLHLDKWASAEPALAMPELPSGPLVGYERSLVDVIGEQGLRITFEESSDHATAVAAAAGWGGDTFAVFRKRSADDDRVALAWRVTFDTERDAREAADRYGARWGKACKARPELGPIAWQRRGKDLALVAGPVVRKGKTVAPGELDCKASATWLKAVLDAKAPATSATPVKAQPVTPAKAQP